jgi:hypothetical protein
MSQILALKQVLEVFSQSTGLNINYHKSSMMPINVDDPTLRELAEGFGCQIGTLPFTYLGLSVGTSRPSIQDLTPVVHRLERRLTATSSFLSQGARLQFILSAISSMPLHLLCTIHIPPGILKQFNRIIRQCLWRDNIDTPKQSLAAWDLICKPKMKGGLGIVDFQNKNEALLMKFLHKFYNKQMDIPWVKLIWDTYYHEEVPHAAKSCGSYWWRDISKLMDKYRGVTRPDVHQGDFVLFWLDEWEIGDSRVPLSIRFSRIFSYVKDDKISVRDMILLQDRAVELHLPLSERAHEEWQLINSWIDSVQLSTTQPDAWNCIWGKYTAAKYYNHLYENVVVCPLFKWIWKSKCIMRVKMFAWLLLSDRLNTRDMLQCRHWHVTETYDCVLCSGQHRETRDHLFFNCQFSMRVWNYLQIV